MLQSGEKELQLRCKRWLEMNLVPQVCYPLHSNYSCDNVRPQMKKPFATLCYRHRHPSYMLMSRSEVCSHFFSDEKA